MLSDKSLPTDADRSRIIHTPGTDPEISPYMMAQLKKTRSRPSFPGPLQDKHKQPWLPSQKSIAQTGHFVGFGLCFKMQRKNIFIIFDLDRRTHVRESTCGYLHPLQG